MDRLSQRRDETAPRSRRSQPRRTKTLNKSYSESPSKPERPKIKKEKTSAKKNKEPEGKLYATKDQAILSEKRGTNGEIVYLVNWADDPVTGQTYAPGWEPEENIDEAGKLQWAEQKQEGLVINRGGELVLRDPKEDASQQSTKRRRSSGQLSQEQAPSKKPRRAGTSETARFQSGFQQSLQSQEVPEVKDTYEDEILPLSAQQIQVRVGVPAGFDRGQYRPILISSQSSPESSQEVSIPQHSTESYSLQDSLPQESTQYSSQLESRRLFPTRHSQFIIPDSQDQLDSGSYEPSTNPGRSQETTQQDSEQDSQPVEVSQLCHSHPESIDTEAVEEPLDDIECTYRTTSSLLDELVPRAKSSSSRRSRASPLQTVPESTQATNKSHQTSQNLSAKSSQLLTPNHEPQYSQDGHAFSSLSQPNQSARYSHESDQETNSNTSSQNEYISPNEKVQSNSSEQQIVASNLLSPVNTHLDHSLPPSSQEDPQLLRHHKSPSDNKSTQRSWSEGYSNATKASSWLHSTRVSSAVLHTQHQTFSPSQVPAQDHHHLSLIQNEALPYSESVQSTPEPSDRVLQSIEGLDYEDDISPLQNRGYGNSSPAVMDDEAAARLAANRAARRNAHRQKVNLSIASDTASQIASALPPSSLPLLNNILSGDDAAEDQGTLAARADSIRETDPEDHVIGILRGDTIDDVVEDQFAVKTGVPEEIQALPQDYLSGGDPFDQYTEEATPERATDKSLQVLPNSENEFFLPLPFTSLTRDVYHKQQGKTRDLRNVFTESETLYPETVRQIDEVLSAFDLLCSHSDLIEEDSSTQAMKTDGAEAKFAETISSKCIFIAELLDSMRQLDKHVIILVRPGRMLEILQAVLIHHKYSLLPQSKNQYKHSATTDDSLKISLISTDSKQQFYASPDLIIAFDSTFTEEPYLRNLRFNKEKQTLCPLVHLLVVFSIEHISRAVPKDIEDVERKVKICNILSEYVSRVGILDDGYPAPDGAAQLVSRFIAAGAPSDCWPCPSMPYIDDADAETPADSASVRQSTSYTTPIPAPTPQQAQQGSKRRLEGEDDIMDIGTPKRQRLTPLPDEQEIRNGLLPFLPQSSTDQDRRSNTPSMLEKSFLTQENALLKELAELKATLRKKENSEAQVRRLNESLQKQVNDLSSSITEIQPKFQAALDDRGMFEYQANEAIAQVGKLKHKLDFRNEEFSKLKEQKLALEADLAAARTALSSSSIPAVAELEKLKAEIRALQEDKARLEKNKSNAAEELDYVRALYRKASDLATESANDRAALQSDLDIQRAKADENRVEIHRIQHTSDVQNLTRMNKHLRIQTTEMARDLEKKTNELAAAMNGRRSARETTRGVSVPMLSPRLAGSPANGMPRGAVHRVRDSGGAGSRSGSRGNSPVGGEHQRGFTPVPSSTSTSRFQPSGPFGDVLPSHATSGGNKVEGGSRRRDTYRPT